MINIPRPAARVLAAVLFPVLATLAPAQKIALVVGCGNYDATGKEMASADIPSADNDAGSLASALGETGFKVLTAWNPSAARLREVVAEFAVKATGAEVAVFSFSGHALAVDGKNYLLPVDAVLGSKEDLAGQVMPLDGIVHELRDAKIVAKLVVLDCCRQNPFGRGQWRTGHDGLADLPEDRIPSGMLVAFSSLPGQSSGQWSQSGFGLALAREWSAPGARWTDATTKVAATVRGGPDGRAAWERLGAVGAGAVAAATQTAPTEKKPSGPAAATTENPYRNGLGLEFSPVPGTRILLAKTETRRMDFARFVEETGYQCEASVVSEREGEAGEFGHSWKAPGFTQTGEHPVAGVSIVDARAFCEWLQETETASGELPSPWTYRLPTDREWSLAAGLKEAKDPSPEDLGMEAKAIYAWGNQWPPPRGAANILGILGGTAPVGNYPGGPNGFLGLTGNVAEWCDSLYRPGKNWTVVRGGSWYRPATGAEAEFRLGFRDFHEPDVRSTRNGFRLVLAP